MPLPAPSQPTFPRRRSRRSFRRRPPSNNSPSKRSDRNSAAKFPFSLNHNNSFDPNTNGNDTPSSGSFRFHPRSKVNSQSSSSSATFRFRRSHSHKNKDKETPPINPNANGIKNFGNSAYTGDTSFGSLRFQSARNSHAQPPPMTSLRHSNASSPSLRFQSARTSAAQPPPQFQQHPSNPSPTPTTTYASKSTGSFRFQNSRSSPLKSKGAFKFKKSKSKHFTPDYFSAQHQSDACQLINRVVRTNCVRKGVLKVLMEIDSLVQYAERDVSTVDIMAKRILGIHNQSSTYDVHCENDNYNIDFDVRHSNIVVQKQLQAASVLHALRIRPDNSVIHNAKTIIKSARTLVDTDVQTTPESNVSNLTLCQMERTLYQAANDLVDVDTAVTVREQVLELLVLTARKRAETDQHTPSSNISSSSSSELNISNGQHEPVEDAIDIDLNVDMNDENDDDKDENHNHNHNSDDSTEEKLEYVLKYQHQFQDWAPVTVKESFPGVRENHNDNKKETKQGKEKKRREKTKATTGKIHENYSAEEAPNACTLITRSWKAHRLESCNTITQLKRLKFIRTDLRTRLDSENGNHDHGAVEAYMPLPSLKVVDALTNEVLVLLGEVESMECETLKRLAETYVTELVPLLAATRRRTSAWIISRAVSGYRIRYERLPVTLLRVETIVTAAIKRNTETGYRDGLDRLSALETRKLSTCNSVNMIVQRAIKAAKSQLMQKHNGTRRIEELRNMARKSEAEQRDREAVENKAQEWITWWTDYGIARSDLRLLLATLHRILPGWSNDEASSAENALEIDDPVKIRSIYRKALLHVHPDRLSRRKLQAFEQVMAQKIFVELQEAYNLFVENELSPSNEE